MSTTHKAAVLHQKGGKPQVELVPTPKPSKGELLVRLEAVATNPVDWKISRYLFYIPGLPFILGVDGAGTVVEVGEGVSSSSSSSSSFSKGDRVAVFSTLARKETNTHQEYVIATDDLVIRLPADLPFDLASTLPLGYFTAGLGLFLELGLPLPDKDAKLTDPLTPESEPLLVWGAASSVGQFVVQLARLAGHRVIATASPNNFELVRSLGASEVIDYRDEGAVEKIREAASPKGLRYVFDSISEKGTTEKSARAIDRENGHIVVVLPGSEAKREGVKVSSVQAVTVHNLDGKTPKARELGQKLVQLAGVWLANGNLKPNKARVVPGGLNGIGEGWELSEKGVSGVKLVHIISETQ